MKKIIIIPRIFLDLAEIAYGKENTYPIKNFYYGTHYPMLSDYILYEKKNKKFIPVLENVLPYTIQFAFFNKDIELTTKIISYEGKTRNIQKEEIMNYLSDEIKEYIYNLYTLLKITYSIHNFQNIFINLIDGYIVDNTLYAKSKLKKISKDSKQATIIPTCVINLDFITQITEMLTKIGAQKAQYGEFPALYLLYPLYDLNKIKQNYSFSEKDLKSLLDRKTNSKLSIEKKMSPTAPIPNYRKKASYVKFSIEVKNITEEKLNKILYSLSQQREVSLIPEKGHINEQHTETIYSVTRLNENTSYLNFFIVLKHSKHKLLISSETYIPRNFMRDLDLDLSSKIIQAMFTNK